MLLHQAHTFLQLHRLHHTRLLQHADNASYTITLTRDPSLDFDLLPSSKVDKNFVIQHLRRIIMASHFTAVLRLLGVIVCCSSGFAVNFYNAAVYEHAINFSTPFKATARQAAIDVMNGNLDMLEQQAQHAKSQVINLKSSRGIFIIMIMIQICYCFYFTLR